MRRSKGKGMKEMVDSRCFSSSSVCPAVWRRPGVDGGLRKKQNRNSQNDNLFLMSKSNRQHSNCTVKVFW